MDPCWQHVMDPCWQRLASALYTDLQRVMYPTLQERVQGSDTAMIAQGELHCLRCVEGTDDPAAKQRTMTELRIDTVLR
jgi:hypothetical protein